jgi:hypothetical protein
MVELTTKTNTKGWVLSITAAIRAAARAVSPINETITINAHMRTMQQLRNLLFADFLFIAAHLTRLIIIANHLPTIYLNLSLRYVTAVTTVITKRHNLNNFDSVQYGKDIRIIGLHS